MFRLPPIFLSVLGLLLCPFVCLGNGDLCGRVDRSACQCSMQVADSDMCCHENKDDNRSDENVPCQDDCGHECVASQGKVESGMKSAREIIQDWMDVDFGSAVVDATEAVAFKSTLPKRLDRASAANTGTEMRLVLASLLL